MSSSRYDPKLSLETQMQYVELEAEKRIGYLMEKCDAIDSRLNKMTEKVREIGALSETQKIDYDQIPFTDPNILLVASDQPKPLGKSVGTTKLKRSNLTQYI
ncbi:uncharacterized protein LOC119672801 [Teleopsis dalmanni]|uniref:uncharacterized protein LOC119672801 n=1 Tax=Teleopsis dalmanni TaxID=139649 RepID=UPI0018CF60ED|nr:uncharacterized protein LOC119672801 [Teleopsis dalmanni]